MRTRSADGFFGVASSILAYFRGSLATYVLNINVDSTYEEFPWLQMRRQKNQHGIDHCSRVVSSALFHILRVITFRSILAATFADDGILQLGEAVSERLTSARRQHAITECASAFVRQRWSPTYQNHKSTSATGSYVRAAGPVWCTSASAGSDFPRYRLRWQTSPFDHKVSLSNLNTMTACMHIATLDTFFAHG